MWNEQVRVTWTRWPTSYVPRKAGAGQRARQRAVDPGRVLVHQRAVARLTVASPLPCQAVGFWAAKFAPMRATLVSVTQPK